MAESKQRKTILRFIESIGTLDVDTNISLRAPTCRDTMLPSSVGSRPNRTNGEFVKSVIYLKQTCDGIPITPIEILESGNQIIVHCHVGVKWRKEVLENEVDDGVEWYYQNEYLFVFLMSEDGEKVERILQFVDKGEIEAAQRLVQRARKNLSLDLAE